jgi:F-type H+-transporting ATPase subunit epsilon
MDGDFGVLADHAPLVALLRPGVLTVRVGSDAQRLVIFGGFAEVSPQGLTVLADYATSLEDLDLAMLAARIAETEDKIKHIEVGSLLDRELERLDHFKAVGTHLQSTGMH